jgi:hypothetical protein
MSNRFSESPVSVQEYFDRRVEPWLQGFADKLKHAGYGAMTARRHIRAAEHFRDWTDQRGIAVATLNESFVEKFGQHLRRCRVPRYGRSLIRIKTNGAHLFLSYLRNAGIVSSTLSETPTPEPALLTAFHQWMRQQRGTCDATLHSYTPPIRELLQEAGDDPCRFDAQKLREFVLKRSRHSGWAAIKKCTTAVRMFLRFLIADGKCPAVLEAAIFFGWRIGVSRLCLGTFDRRTSNALLRAAIAPRPWVDETARFCFYSHAWHFERVILLSWIWRISIGNKRGSMYWEKGDVRRGCP